MGARGPHDDFDTARKQIIAGYATFNVDQDLEAVHRKYLADDLEYVTRHGTFHGPEKYLADFGVQLEQWRAENEIDEIIDAGEGALIVTLTTKRIDKESGELSFKTWPAIVMRVHGGKMAFFEGYIDRRKAFADYGVERD